MTEQAQAAPGGQETAPAEQKSSQEDAAQEQQPKVYDEAYVAELRKENAKARTANKSLEKQLEDTKAQSMSEAEKAIAEAERRGRTASATEFAQRLARTEFDARAGRRNPDLSKSDITEILELVDLGRFVTEDGEPDEKAIEAAVARLVPEPGEKRPPSYDAGTRQPPPAGNDMNRQIRAQLGR